MATDDPPLQALTWIAPGHEFAALTKEPGWCSVSAKGLNSRSIAGMALFNTPQLLGGQAARAGVSCASCHTNGRRNEHFFLAGVSLTPGTADVSSSFFSPARGNATFDPKPIPDLAMPGKVSRDPANGDLERFLRGLIVEEFAGHEPPKAALAALAAYVREIGPCKDQSPEISKQGSELRKVRLFIQAAAAQIELDEDETAVLLIGGARHQLGLIHDRYRGTGLRRERQLLVTASRRLQSIGDTRPLRHGGLLAWQMHFDTEIAPHLQRAEPRSLYDERVLARWLVRR